MTRSHTLGRKTIFEHAQNFFSSPACEQRVSWRVIIRPKYVPGPPVTRRTGFAGVLHSLLTRRACRWSPNAGECKHIHHKVWSEINYPFSHRPHVTSNYIHHKVWDEITYPSANFNGTTVEVWEWINNFFPHFTGRVITYACLDLS